MIKTTFVAACMKYFGRREGQSLQQFGDEVKRLTAENRAELTALFPSVGYEIEEPVRRVAA